jgi:hypothetical protein
MRAGRSIVVAAIAGATIGVPAAGLGAGPSPSVTAVQQASATLSALPYRAELRLLIHVGVRGGGAAARRGLPAGAFGQRMTGEIVADSPGRFMETLTGSTVPLGKLILLSYDGANYVSHDDGQHYFLLTGEAQRFFVALKAQAGTFAPQGVPGLRTLAGLRALAPRVVNGVPFAHYAGRLTFGDVSGVVGTALGRSGAIPQKLARALGRAVHFTGGRQDFWVSPQGVLVRQASAFSARFDLGALARLFGGADATTLRGVRLAFRGTSTLQVEEYGQPPSVVRPTPVGTVSSLSQLALR